MWAGEEGDEHQLDRRLLPDDGLGNLGPDLARKGLDFFDRHPEFSLCQL